MRRPWAELNPGAHQAGAIGFFDPPPLPPEPAPRRSEIPPWLGPPDNVLGVAVPLEPLPLVHT